MGNFRLPRLPRDQEITDPQGRPKLIFQRWWQSTVEKIEGTINAISDLVEEIAEILIAVGIAQETADGSLALAQQAINPDGTIKDDKVITQSLVTDAVTERYFSQALTDIILPDGVETEVTSITVQKVSALSEMDIDMAIRLSSTDDIQGVIRVYRDADVIDTFNPYIAGPGSTLRTIFTMPLTESDTAPGEYVYRVTFMKDGGATTLRALARSNLRIKEIKR